MNLAFAKQLFDYDPATGILRWRIDRNKVTASRGSVAGGPDKDGYWRVRVLKREYRAHRVAWLLVYGEWPSKNLDHINGEKMDNRIENLRLATASENMANTGPTKRNTSGYRGVCETRFGTFQASICCNRRHHHIGTFRTAEEAARAYDVKARELFGPYAKPNFPDTNMASKPYNDILISET